MAIRICNNKGMYDRDVKDEELLGSVESRLRLWL